MIISQHFGSQMMSSRQQVKTACQHCRQKRAKCNGEQPCNRCNQQGEVCEYNRRKRVSKSELRADIGRLRQRLEDAKSQRAQDQGSSATTNGSAALQGWTDAVKWSNLEKGPFVLPGGDRAAFSSDSISRGTSLTASSCFDQLLSWRSCHPTFQQCNASRSSSLPLSSRELSLPLAPLDAYTTLAQTDGWTQVGWTCAHIRHLFDVLYTWDCVSFCILRKKEFLQDYDAGSSRFCSSALVHALLALSIRIVNETEDDSYILPSGWLGSKYFLRKAKSLLREQGSGQSLPDIQSLGILALYHIRCGQENEARELVKLCTEGIRSLCLRECDVSELDELYIKVRAATYGGAISLLRMFYLTTGVLFNDNGNTLEDSFILDQLPCNDEAASTMRPDRSTAINFQPANPHNLITKLFQLTELVYMAIVANQRAAPSTKEDIIATYQKCLVWYGDLFELVGNDSSRSPFILFIHMYYHFCILCTFRPFVGSNFAPSEVQPHEMCVQAVQSILILTQSYDDLFTLQRIPAWIPYFVCASGLFSLAIEDSRADMDFINLRPRAAISPQKPHLSDSRAGLFPPEMTASSEIKSSTVVQARLLLSRMGVSHPAAAMAKEKLNESLKTWRRSGGAGSY
ncbi:nitrate assimilation regulatory protein nirA [Beauveria bassiana ARSEF 2860]|uniref:Nitrate assimilation regulatory protein nirA n=1 Tax=Beauveria bassiana (strain ARSEF 2860) TaxID=655819 RepID=J4VU28_BEAB2|nr:nitrate assimilation regulatory protein nirA [Beauveria bassiana ARSEF 2860]EJP62035.1 nitrate assimilation regulatory protein nirA [Beauveria bassiana ARSEF 2860]